MSVVPLQETAEYSIRVDLDNIPCNFRIYWTEFSDAVKSEMDTNGFWSMDINNSLFDIKGIRLVGGTELMWPYSYDFGGFVFYDMEGKNEDPSFTGMGRRWQLNYIPKAELLSFREELRLETV